MQDLPQIMADTIDQMVLEDPAPDITEAPQPFGPKEQQIITETLNRIGNVRRSLIQKAIQENVDDPDFNVDRSMLYAVIQNVQNHYGLPFDALTTILMDVAMAVQHEADVIAADQSAAADE